MAQKRKVVDAKVKQAIKTLVQKMKQEKFHFKEIYLFGSHAKGFGRAGSDIDLCIVQENKFGKHHFKEWCRAIRIAGELMIAADIIVTTEKDFKFNKISPLLHEIRETGIKVA